MKVHKEADASQVALRISCLNDFISSSALIACLPIGFLIFLNMNDLIKVKNQESIKRGKCLRHLVAPQRGLWEGCDNSKIHDGLHQHAVQINTKKQTI